VNRSDVKVKIVTDELELRKPCERVSLSEISDIRRIVPSIIRIMINNDGIGLAANQVGISKAFFIAEIRGEVKLFINPKIIAYSKERSTDQEGCLSFPGVHKNLERSNQITIQYFDCRTKKIVKESYLGFSARIIQHEYDHLQGVCCILDKAIEEEEILCTQCI
jgi:peptide deformylase